MRYIFLILVLGFLLRTIGLNSLPPGFSGDEAQQGYSAYSIFKTGRDEWGQFLPLNPRGFGDYKSPLQTYLIVPFVGFLGLNEAVVRFPAVIFGVLTILIVYLVTFELFQNKTTAFWSAFLLTVSPWHIQLSRTAFEGGIGVMLFCLGLLFFLKGLSRKKYLILAAVTWGLSLYTYHSFKLFTLLFVLGAVILQKGKILKRENIIALFVLLIFIAPTVFNLNSGLKRASDVGLISTVKNYFKDKGTSPIPSALDRVVDNKYWFLSNALYSNYLTYFSPQFFFTGDRSDSSYLNFPNFPLLYPIELVFWLFAFYQLIFKRIKNYKYLLLWFLLAPIPASLAQGSLHAHRAVTFIPLVSIVSAIGVTNLVVWCQERVRIKKYLMNRIIIGLLFLSLVFFLHFYLVTLPQRPPPSLRKEYQEIFTKALELQDQYDYILMTRMLTVPQIFVAFYGKVDPNYYQQSSQDWLRYERAGKLYIDQLESWNLGKYLFEDLYYEKNGKNRINTLLISKPEDFPEKTESIYNVYNAKAQIIFRFVPTKSAIDEKTQ